MAKRKIACVDTRPPRESSVKKHAPYRVGERRRMLERYGSRAFLLPKGTKARPDVPSYPIVSAKTGCFHCNMMRIAYTRIGAAINREKQPARRKELEAARRRLIRLAKSFADQRDARNTCNFAIMATKRYL